MRAPVVYYKGGGRGVHSFISKLCLTTPREGNKVAAFCLLASCLRCCRCFFGSLLRFFMFLHFTFGFYARYKHAHTHTSTHTQRHARQRHTDRHKKSLHTFLGCGELRAKHIRRGNLYVPICPVCVWVCVCVSVWVNVFMYVCMSVCVLACVCPPLAARQKHKLDFFLSLRVAIHVDVCVSVSI